MAEIEGLACRKVFLDVRPLGYLGCIAKQHADNRGTFAGFFNAEERFSWHPSVGNRFLKSFSGALAYDYTETIIAQITSLTWSLNTVADNSNGFVGQNFTCFLKREFLARCHFFDDTAKIDLCHI